MSSSVREYHFSRFKQDYPPTTGRIDTMEMTGRGVQRDTRELERQGV